MKRFFLFLLLLPSLWSYAQTIVAEGPQSGIWDADTVRVTGDVVVSDSLRILPGTVVLFEGFYGITVSGQASFFAQGAEGDSIVFTVADTTCIGLYNSPKGAWNGIDCFKSGSVRLDYCVLQYAKASDTLDMSGGALKVRSVDDVEINHSVFRYNYAREHGGALAAEQSAFRMSNCVVHNNRVFSDDNLYFRYGGGMRFLKCDVRMEGMDFHDNDGSVCVGGALSFDSCSLVLERSVFHHNIGVNGGGLYLMRSNDKKGLLSNLLFYDNISEHFAGALAFCDASPEVYNVTVTGNTSIGVTCNGVFFYQESSPRLTNCVIYGNYPFESEVLLDTIQMWMWTFENWGPEFRNCLIEGGTSQMQSAESILCFEDVVDADPLFVDSEHHDYRLSGNSPCRDAGWVLTPDEIQSGVDLDGMPRVSNGRIDMGPYEYSSVSVGDVGVDAPFARLEGLPLGGGSRLVLRLEDASDVTLQVYSIQGRQVATRRFGHCVSGVTVLPLEGLTDDLRKGVYLMEISAGEKTCVIKAVR